MRVLLVHNYYQQAGGEDVVFEGERSLLVEAGHQVATFTVHNDALAGASPAQMATQTVWNSAAARSISQAVENHRAEVAHFHNTFPVLSPAVYRAAKAAGAATVQTLHNYRLLCANALFYRDGHVCEDCLGGLPWPAVRHRCYRQSLGASAAVAACQVIHGARGTYRREVDAFVALTTFARDKFIQGGLPAERLHVKPNFLNEDPGEGTGGGGYALYIGRLTPEKGVRTALDAWENQAGLPPLKVVGDGPLASEVERAAQRNSQITWLGQRPRAEVLELAKEAECLVFPSVWYEGFPMTVVEAYGVGLPVIASRVGALEHLVEDGCTGLLFSPGDAAALSAVVRQFMATDRAALRRQARQKFLSHYTGLENLQLLLSIYATAVGSRRTST